MFFLFIRYSQNWRLMVTIIHAHISFTEISYSFLLVHIKVFIGGKVIFSFLLLKSSYSLKTFLLKIAILLIE